MSRSLLHDWECVIDRCCRDDNPKEMISIAEDIYNTAYARGKNHSDVTEVLDKIRADIDNINLNEVAVKYEDRFYGFQREVIKILDKYKEESEEV